MSDKIKSTTDIITSAIAASTLVKLLPPMAAIITILWGVYRLFTAMERRYYERIERKRYLESLSGYYKQPVQNFDFLPIEQLRKLYSEMNRRKKEKEV